MGRRMAGSAETAPAALPREGASTAAWPILASLLVACAAGFVSLALAPTNVDVSWLLVVCGRLLDGAELHVDIVEVNPPFSIWLYMPFALAERATGLPAEFWLAVGLPLLALMSVGLCARILGRGSVLDARCAWLSPAVLAGILLLFPGDFGQREQFAVIALLPWLALLAARDRKDDFRAGTAAERIVGGLGAGVFVMIKPPLAVFALALPALFLCVRRRSLRPLFTTESLLGAALTLAYIAWLAAFHMAFFVDLLPLLRDLYLPARMPVADLLFDGPVRIFAILAAATWALAWPRQMDRLASILLQAALAYVPAFVIMGKGWAYQALPFLMLGLIAFLIQFRTVTPRLAEMPVAAKGGAAVGLATIVLVISAGQPLVLAERRIELAQAATAIERVVTRPTVASIATRLQPAHPLTLMIDGDYRQLYPSLWVADNAVGLIWTAGEDVEKVERLMALRDGIIRQTARDIERERPDIIFDAGSDGTPGQRVVHANPEIARVLSGYRLLYRDKVETIFVRSDLSPEAGKSIVGSGLAP